MNNRKQTLIRSIHRLGKKLILVAFQWISGIEQNRLCCV